MILCADDYGMRDDIDRAILQLCEQKKLSAVSCMVLFERCDQTLMKKIRAHENHADIGLHFCLTHEELPLSAPLEKIKLPEFKTLFRRALLRKIKRAEIFKLLAAQYELFLQKSGRAPDYIDGHLHAHQLPVVAGAVVEFARQLPRKTYVRNTKFPAAELRRRKLPWLKAKFIGGFGTRLEKKLRSETVPTNSGFAGIYDFKKWRNYETYLPKFADCLENENGILVAHPGFDEDWRKSEVEALQKFSGTLNRFRF